MDELDFSAEIAALRSTFADIRAVVGVERLETEIASLSEQAGVPEEWTERIAADLRVEARAPKMRP